ncbi:dolichol-phosphate mannosyltransferase subunit 3 [Leucosporidium creatinivorum]|uniref:Dolichol-phosphate mannosyltransferase subunit 3 n=1 Tax=Leucosporidium creatinivorum TaxID=106004 RepID=A0A1Y2FXU1_9BASI|nr:dolichol-phosphate mannosyltransferase subunit 3 [Leucosporidium creatinivorum]
MTRQAKFVSTGSALLLIYLSLWFRLLPTPFLDDSIRDQIVPCLPFNLLVALGSYCLWELGMGVLTFGECEGAYEELMKEIKEARDDLRTKGVSVD